MSPSLIRVPDLLSADALYDDEPVAGLSDAFLIGDSELHVYHTLNVGNPDVLTNTVVVFKAKPTCIKQQESLSECLTQGGSNDSLQRLKCNPPRAEEFERPKFDALIWIFSH
jgi:hypothetical protein